MKQKYEHWLDCFRRLHKLKTKEEAIEKLIDIYKAWNTRFV